jgi:hypothetical protein
MVSVQNLTLSDGRTLRVHESADRAGGADAFTALWQHGSPQTGALLEPLLVAAAARGTARPGLRSSAAGTGARYGVPGQPGSARRRRAGLV